MSNTTFATVATQNFDDIDHYMESVSSEMDLKSTQIGTGKLHLKTQQITLGDIFVSRYTTSCLMADSFSIIQGYTYFVLTPSTRQHSCNWCGIEVPPDSLVMLHSGQEHFVRVPQGWNVIELMLPNALICQVGLLPEKLWEQSKIPENGIFPLLQPKALAFRHTMHQLFVNPEQFNTMCFETQNHALISNWILDNLRDVFTTFSSLLTPGTSTCSQNVATRFTVFMEARQIIEENLCEKISPCALAKEVGTTPRTLQYAFQDILGISPSQYILCRKLHCSRTEMLRIMKTERSPVANAAMRYEINHLGRFSNQYKHLFGETPTATINRLKTQ